jgi:hypothetical protein
MLEVTRTAGFLLDTQPRAGLIELRERPYNGSDSFERWARDESHPLAIAAAYRDGRLAGAADKANAPRLSESYTIEARALAARRMALAGYRLADILRAIFRISKTR